jgi:choline-sulfatase
MAPRERPNLLSILTDDQGYWALGCYGNEEIRTPNLDRLARTGIRFDDFFCASPVCSPARASILTGRIPSRHGIHDWIRKGNMAEDGHRAIEYLRGQTAYTEILARNGYTCALSGKWHLGHSLLPQKGFDHWYVHQTGGSNYHGAPMIRDGRPYEEPGYVTDAITDDALGFLEGRREVDPPFYLGVHYTAPHSPWVDQHPEEIVDSYDGCPFASCPDEPAHPWQIRSAPRGTGERRREILKGYFAAVTAMDQNVGRLLDCLEEKEMREDTLVIFMSDNGMNMGHHGFFGKGNGTFPLNMYDTSVKVPALLSMPGTCPENRVEEGLYSQYDVMPTILEFMGLDNPEGEGLPGRSFSALLNGEELPGRREIFVFDEYGPVRMVRDGRWKYVHRYAYGPHELYNLEDDPGERVNLYGDEGLDEIVAGLKARLDRFFHRYVDPALDGSREAVFGKGQIDLAGPAGEGRKAFMDDYTYMGADGSPRDEGYRPGRP